MQHCDADMLDYGTHLCKIRFLLQKSPTTIQIRMFNIVTQCAYCDCFNPEEQWLIATTSPHTKRCIVRQNTFINFHAYSMLSGLIKSKALSAQMENFNTWTDWAKKKLTEYPEL